MDSTRHTHTLTQILISTLLGAVAGLFIGFWISVVFNLIYSRTNTYYPSSPAWTESFPSLMAAIIVSALLWMALGIVFAQAGYWIFVRNPFRMGLTGTTAAHFVVTLLGTFTVAVCAGWVHLSWVTAASFLVQFAPIYLVIWGTSMLQRKRRARKLNAQLDSARS